MRISDWSSDVCSSDLLVAVERAVGRLYPDVRLDIDGDKTAVVRVERQDLDEMLGNLVENAAKYGGGSVFVTVMNNDNMVELVVEDDGKGIPERDPNPLFDRGDKLAFRRPGTGHGVAIVCVVAE